MLVLVCLEIVLILTQHKCTVCVECSIGSEIVLDAPDGSPMFMWNLVSIHLGIVKVSVQYSCKVFAKHRSEIILDTPDGTPR
jgi:hypothetical protein